MQYALHGISTVHANHEIHAFCINNQLCDMRITRERNGEHLDKGLYVRIALLPSTTIHPVFLEVSIIYIPNTLLPIF